jgi:hypothetical protein
MYMQLIKNIYIFLNIEWSKKYFARHFISVLRV